MRSIKAHDTTFIKPSEGRNRCCSVILFASAAILSSDEGHLVIDLWSNVSSNTLHMGIIQHFWKTGVLAICFPRQINNAHVPVQ